MNIKLPAGVWVDIYATTGIAVGTQIEVINLTPSSVRLSSTVIEPVQIDSHFLSLYGRGSVRNTSGDEGAWAMCLAGGAIDVYNLAFISSWANASGQVVTPNGIIDLKPGDETGFMIGSTNKVMSTVSSTIWDYGGNYPYPPSNTQLYVSSTSALDVGNLIVNPGMTDDYVRATAVAVTNGQNQVPLSAELFRVFVSINGTAEGLHGEIYIAEADTLTNGVPDTPSKIKNVIPLSTDSQGTIVDMGTEYESDNISHLGSYTVPVGYVMRVVDIYTGVTKNDDVKVGARVKLLGGPWLNRNAVNSYQSELRINFQGLIVLPEKTEFQARAIAGSDGSSAQMQALFVLEKQR